ncbi:MAG: xanthine dehydrogenase family protein molybdopterin-binding subunit [Acidobacteria bacterium]|nr:xanthine dehydrogenase family protein molybdopterin-binding subunit [Acidobacteriota bacterium]
MSARDLRADLPPKGGSHEEPDIEFERYELRESLPYLFDVDRRSFLKVFGTGVAVIWTVDQAGAQESGGARRAQGAGRPPAEVGAWLHIDEHGAVSVYTGKVEIGQNIRTSLAQAVAEELHVDPASLTLVMGDTTKTPFDMGTFGSRTTPFMAPQLRKAAATARELLIGLAAEALHADRAHLDARDGRIHHTITKRSVSFGELTKGRRLIETINEPALTPANAWTRAGQPLHKLNARAIVTGTHQYPSDITRPGMRHGKVVRPPQMNSTLTRVDTAVADKMTGVTVVRDGEFIGVVASSEYAADQAAFAIHSEWSAPKQPSRAELFGYLKANPTGSGGGGNRTVGSIEEGLRSADRTFNAQYTVEYIAHVPLEPRAAVAEWQDGALTVWTGTQRPFGVQAELAEAFHLPPDRVRVIVPDTGSAYGGKHTGETAIEAARLAKASGHPVKLVWTREEEFRWAYFRPAGVIDVRSGVTRDSRLVAWEFHNYNSGPAAIGTPYDIPHQRIQFHATRSPLRQGSYRGLAATANHFARESHMDEVAHALGLDPLEFRLRNLKDERLKAVLTAAASRFGWQAGSAARRGVGSGIAGGVEKGGYLATCAELAIEPGSGQVTLGRIVAAFECGAIVNPDGLRNQVEGSIIMGIGGALFEAVDFDNGEILNASLADYRVPRFSDVPPIEVVLLDRKDLPSAGAGETPIVGVAPAIANAIFAATGIRLRDLPLAPKGVLASATSQAPV